MSNCRDHTEHLSSYIEGILTSEKTKEIKNHLGSCNVCLEKYEDLKALMVSVKSLPKVEASPNFENRLKSVLNGTEKPAVTISMFDRLVPNNLTGMLLAAASVSILALVINLNFIEEKPKPLFSPRIQLPAVPQTTIADPRLNSPLKSFAIKNLGTDNALSDSLNLKEGNSYPNQQIIDRLKDQAVQVGSKRNK